jgi:hypothetical protein
VSGTERARQNGSGERQERDVHQQQGVEEQHHPVGAADVVEHDVMVGPHLPDEQEGDGVRQVGRPERGEAVEQVPGVLRRADLQDEQGDGDGEDRIAEEDDPRGIAFRAEPLPDPAGSSGAEVVAIERNQRITKATPAPRHPMGSRWQRRAGPCGRHRAPLCRRGSA